jgi:hypothetical protein
VIYQRKVRMISGSYSKLINFPEQVNICRNQEVACVYNLCMTNTSSYTLYLKGHNTLQLKNTGYDSKSINKLFK